VVPKPRLLAWVEHEYEGAIIATIKAITINSSIRVKPLAPRRGLRSPSIRLANHQYTFSPPVTVSMTAPVVSAGRVVDLSRRRDPGWVVRRRGEARCALVEAAPGVVPFC
jgi:hypothetical protein